MKTEIVIDGVKYRRVEEEPVYEHNGLMWSKTFTQMTWQEAINFCENLNYGGYSDWRLATIKELITIIDFSNQNLACFSNQNPACFLPYTVSSSYWSSTAGANDTDGAWDVDFSYGGVYYEYNKESVLYVRAVRG